MQTTLVGIVSLAILRTVPDQLHQVRNGVEGGRGREGCFMRGKYGEEYSM